MNFFLITALFAIVSSSYGANIMGKTKQDILKLIEERCDKNAPGKNAFQDLKDAITPLTECIENAMGNLTSNHVSNYNTFCEVSESGNYHTCLENFAKKVRPCLDTDEEYLPDFVMTSINASIVEYCGEEGRNKINAVLNDIVQSTCFSKYITLEPLQSRCIDKLVLYNNIAHDTFTTIKKEDLCSDLLSFKGCVIEYLQEICNEDHSDIVSLLADPYLAAC